MTEPHFGIDGWTYQGTALEERFPGHVEAELAPLTHLICAGTATTWTFERAARLLEGEGAFGQAYAVIEAAVAAASGAGQPVDGGLVRWRGRLAVAVLERGAG